MKTKRKFRISRNAICIIIIVAHFPLAASAFGVDRTSDLSLGLQALSLITLNLIIFITATFMALTLWKFTQIVARFYIKLVINHCLMALQIICIIVWVVAGIALALDYMLHYNDIYSYGVINRLSIFDLVSIDANFINFVIMGLILLRSS